MDCPVRSNGHLRRQAAYMADQMRAFRGLVVMARRMETQPGVSPALLASWRHFNMDSTSRRDAFESWRQLHRSVVARLEVLP